MTHETKMVKQYMPCMSSTSTINPIEDSSMMTMIAPDDRPEWRFREMHILPALQQVSVMGMTPTTNPQPECIVVWERYEEKE